MKMPRTKSLIREKEISTPANIEIRKKPSQFGANLFFNPNSTHTVLYCVCNIYLVLCMRQQICWSLFFTFEEKGIENWNKFFTRVKTEKGKTIARKKTVPTRNRKQRIRYRFLFFYTSWLWFCAGAALTRFDMAVELRFGTGCCDFSAELAWFGTASWSLRSGSCSTATATSFTVTGPSSSTTTPDFSGDSFPTRECKILL